MHLWLVRHRLFDVTQSEYGAGDGSYQPGPGWDYASGWGALNVANFTQDVDGTAGATVAYTGTEKSACGGEHGVFNKPGGERDRPGRCQPRQRAPRSI